VRGDLGVVSFILKNDEKRLREGEKSTGSGVSGSEALRRGGGEYAS
jgi:hypothetical protein